MRKIKSLANIFLGAKINFDSNIFRNVTGVLILRSQVLLSSRLRLCGCCRYGICLIIHLKEKNQAQEAVGLKRIHSLLKIPMLCGNLKASSPIHYKHKTCSSFNQRISLQTKVRTKIKCFTKLVSIDFEFTINLGYEFRGAFPPFSPFLRVPCSYTSIGFGHLCNCLHRC